MRRVYYMYNAFGAKQSQHRIQMLAEFYGSINSIGAFYPNMYLCGTQKIFKARLRKLRKLKAAHGSSDQSSGSQVESEQSFESSGFLQSLKTSELSSQSNSPQFSAIFSINGQKSEIGTNQVYDIYSNEEDSSVVQSIQIMGQKPLKQTNQQDINHLITQFDDLDAEAILSDYKKLKQLYDYQQNHENTKIMFLPEQISESLIVGPEQDYHRRMYYEKSDYLKNKRKYGVSDPSKVYRRQKMEEIYQNRFKGHQNEDSPMQHYSQLYSSPRNNQPEQYHNRRKNVHKTKTIKDRAVQLLEKVRQNHYP